MGTLGRNVVIVFEGIAILIFFENFRAENAM